MIKTRVARTATVVTLGSAALSGPSPSRLRPAPHPRYQLFHTPSDATIASYLDTRFARTQTHLIPGAGSSPHVTHAKPTSGVRPPARGSHPPCTASWLWSERDGLKPAPC